MKKLLVILLTTLTISTLTACGNEKVVSQPPEGLKEVKQETVKEYNEKEESNNQEDEQSPEITEKDLKYYQDNKDSIEFKAENLKLSAEEDGCEIEAYVTINEQPTVIMSMSAGETSFAMYLDSETKEIFICCVSEDGEMAVKTKASDDEFETSYDDTETMVIYEIEEITEVENQSKYDILTCELIDDEDESYEGLVYVDKDTSEILKIEIEEINFLLEAVDEIDFDMSIFDDAEELTEEDFAEYMFMTVMAVAEEAMSEQMEETSNDGTSYLAKEVYISAKEIDLDKISSELGSDYLGWTYGSVGTDNQEYYLIIGENNATIDEYINKMEEDFGYEAEVLDGIIFNIEIYMTPEESDDFDIKMEALEEKNSGIEKTSSFGFNGYYQISIHCADDNALQDLYSFLDENGIEY